MNTSHISQYFIGGNQKNTKKYDVVFTQPVENNYYYRGIDKTKLSKSAPVEYYVVRSLDFLTKGGYLMAVVSLDNVNFIRNNKEILESTEFQEVISADSEHGYQCLILKKK